MTGVAPPLAGPPRVNLMPRSEIARRERDQLVRTWVWIVVGAIVVALLIIAAALLSKFLADQRLAAEQARTDMLLAEIGALSEVSDAIDAEAELTGYRSEAMATDLAWTPVISAIAGTLPAGSRLTGFDLTVGGAPQGPDPAAEKGLVGLVTVESSSPLDLAGIVRGLRDVEGVMFVDGQSLTSGDAEGGSYTYVVDIEFDQSVYSGTYALEGSAD